ncbi:hypothetical protein GCM10010149_09010 [Nonomuraea roseoviolacea subsp. roseoviolacea]
MSCTWAGVLSSSPVMAGRAGRYMSMDRGPMADSAPSTNSSRAPDRFARGAPSSPFADPGRLDPDAADADGDAGATDMRVPLSLAGVRPTRAEGDKQR